MLGYQFECLRVSVGINLELLFIIFGRIRLLVGDLMEVQLEFWGVSVRIIIELLVG